MENNREIVMLSIDKLYPHPDNPRKDLGELQELADSIKAKGVMQNLTVVPRENDSGYTIIIGHRRAAAARLAGLTELPCVITEMTPAEQIQTMLLENMQRSDLTVYEQAQGFQMMMNFGDNIDTVAQKTGFSKSTIHRRLEIAKLNGDTLKAVSDRQPDLMDYDKLSQIEDIATRNIVLASIGTNNFNRELQKALDAQKYAKRKAEWHKILEEHRMTEIPYNDIWDSKYASLGYIDGDSDEGKIKEYEQKYDKLYYAWGSQGTLYVRADKAATKEKSAEELEKERRKEAESTRRKQLSELAKSAFRLRFDFIKNYSYSDSKKNLGKISDWMCLREIVSMMSKSMFEGYATVSASKQRFGELFDVRGGDDWAKLAEFVDKHPEKALLMNVYAQWCDSENVSCTDWDMNYRKNPKLVNLYQGLCALGYEMSDEEEQMVNGTHSLYNCEGDKAIDTEEDEVEVNEEETEDTFDIDLKKRLSELLGEFDDE